MKNNGIVKFEDIKSAFSATDGEVRRYSGRGMYGAECLGVTCSNPTDVVLDAISGFVENTNDTDEVFEFIQMLKQSRTDSMGRDMIIYFPNIEWQDEPDSEDDEESEDDPVDEVSPESAIDP